ncbi:hypothetical protein INN71_03475 [Nocardioides sp. ChNu-153]|uniref:hypothetical protein n=1 Tax=unclassified Nocardioides TaxID=2615069 RepID=UPI00240730AD|nr:MULTISPECIES: hypothetical protein [unclassified Nocardioides]MDF9717506.1 hypothetical protein [Nocardioides sp. ChNu-99]MDN7120448.1 hypothetical protein [Nocardioides sp. ChNu-153]
MSSPRPDRRRRRGGADLLERALEARAQLQEHFFRVDQLQRDVGGTVAQYAALLPDRARSTGVVPAWRQLDQRAGDAVLAYLGVLDAHDPVEDLDPYRVGAATTAFERGVPALREVAEAIDRYLDQYGAELGRVGEVRERPARRLAAAQESVTRAEAAWRAMTEEGFSLPEADEALARARVAARKLAEIADRLGPDDAEEPAAVVERLAEDARSLATELPARLRTLGQRIPSLATRIEAVTTRSERMGEHMSGLRREFSYASWDDLARAEEELRSRVASARDGLEPLRRLHAAGDHAGALAALTRVEDDVRRASDLVDAPRLRLERLREVKRDPEALLERARFALRDARLLLRRGSPQPWGGRLDALAHELIAVEGLLEGAHPDYWQLLTRVERLHAGVDTLVADFRADQAGRTRR